MIITNSLGSNYTPSDRWLATKLLLQPRKWFLGTATEQLPTAILQFFDPGSLRNFHLELFLKGRQAILKAMEDFAVHSGDEVILQAFTCVAVVDPIVRVGATPIFVDLAPRSLNPSLSSIKKAITKRTKAIILQHTLGYVNPQTETIIACCHQRGIRVVQDLAHAFGAPGLRKTTLFAADAIVLSFSQDKVVDGISGGMLMVSDKAMNQKSETGDRNLKKELGRFDLAKLLLYPQLAYLIRSTYPSGVGKIIHFILKNLDFLPTPLKAPTASAKMPNSLAALALLKLEGLNQDIAHRRTVSLIYNLHIHDQFKLVSEEDIRKGVNLRYPILVENREELEGHLKRQGFFLLDHWYDAPVAPALLNTSEYIAGSCPHAEYLANHVFNLPTHTNISQSQALQLAKLVNSHGR